MTFDITTSLIIFDEKTQMSRSIVTSALMLKNAKRTLDNHVLQDGPGRNVNGAVLSCNDDDGA